MRFDPGTGDFSGRGISLGSLKPLIDGEMVGGSPTIGPDRMDWQAGAIRLTLRIESADGALRLTLSVEGLDPDRPIASLGLRVGEASGVRSYLRNGYQSWDGSYFVAPGSDPGGGPPARSPALGFAMTALLPKNDAGAVVLGFERHDRFQNRFAFHGTAESFGFDVETLLDGVPHDGAIAAEPLILLDAEEVEETLRSWSRRVAAASTYAPRLPGKRITGWCSWYNLYAAIDEAVIIENLAAAQTWRDRHPPLDIFLIDDGFTPEMGDWLETKPQFPRGMAPLVAEIDAAGFTPGLWIAPFLVGNRSALFAEHPDWLVRDADHGGPLVHARFYGEFRWHKRSEEYHVLDITHPDAERYIRQVFRTWRHDWGVRYFKTDFMLAGAEYGPDRARWHKIGLSRMAVWRMMAEAIREEIGDALWLGCGCPLWASVGLVDAVRIGRDVGVTWDGDYSAQSLLRDLQSRNHANGLLWQADPDCILLRSRFHELSDAQVESLALFAGLSGGVLMTSDSLDALAPERADLLARLLTARIDRCSFPRLGGDDPHITQIVEAGGSQIEINLFNPTDATIRLPDGSELPPFASRVTAW